MDSAIVVKTLSDVDSGFVDLCKTLFGDVVDAYDAWDYLYGQDPPISKAGPDSADVSTHAGGSLRSRRVKGGALVALGAAGGVVADRATRRRTGSDVYSYSKADDVEESEDDTVAVTWMGEFSKVDDDKREVFGWASVVELDGQPIVDRQGDVISPEEIERAAYTYVVKSRKGGRQHRRTETGDAFHASDMIESVVFTDEKIEKMGLPDEFPRGWWVGYKVNDDDTWQAVKKNEVTSFSIHGRGKRQLIAEVG